VLAGAGSCFPLLTRRATGWGEAAMGEPLAYFLTWTTYGTWLPGDERGWVERRGGWREPDLMLELDAAGRMTETACLLDADARRTVEEQIAETCAWRGWTLLAVNCRSNHVHAVVSAPESTPDKVRSDLKAWSARRLKERHGASRTQWWSDRGSVRSLFDDAALEGAILYTREGQDRRNEGVRGRG
jgi:REP element-mobilizing transposase RayT